MRASSVSAKENLAAKPEPSIRAKSIVLASELMGFLSLAYRKETSDISWEWSPENPELGQCAYAALILQEMLMRHFGEENAGRIIVNIKVFTSITKVYWHVINVLPDNTVIDPTMGQFKAVEKVEILHDDIPAGSPYDAQRVLMRMEPFQKGYDYLAAYGSRNCDKRNEKMVTEDMPGKNRYEDLLRIVEMLQRDGAKREEVRFDRAFSGIEPYVCALLGVDGMDKVDKRVVPCDWESYDPRRYVFRYAVKE